MSNSVAYTALVAAIAIAALLQWGAGSDAAAEVAGNRPAIGTPAPVVATAPAPPSGGAIADGNYASPPAPAATAAGVPAVPAVASEAERLATQEQRREALPHFLQAAEATLARVRGELAQLEARGAPAAEVAAKAEQLRRLGEVRAQVLARNADITTAR